MKICKKCVMLGTRPRLQFNEDGVCSACEWNEIKTHDIDWAKRKQELFDLCDEIRGKQHFDCIVPASGGKDSIYVADKMKNECGLNVLTVTITPPLETDLIKRNMDRFLSHGYTNIKVTPNPEIAREINKYGFIEQGRPTLGWISCLNSVTLRLACAFRVPLIMFGEEGETEYGGSTELRYKPYYDTDFAIKIYTFGNDPASYLKILKHYNEQDLLLWLYPSEKEIRDTGFKVAHWSYYENWDPYNNYIVARDKYGMEVSPKRNTGTYTNFAQLDTPLYELHTYMMYLKFGFGRCLQDACIDIRAGRITRDEAVKLVKQYDGEYPRDNIEKFLDYYQMTKDEFDAVLDRHANKDLFFKEKGIWKPKFDIN